MYNTILFSDCKYHATVRVYGAQAKGAKEHLLVIESRYSPVLMRQARTQRKYL